MKKSYYILLMLNLFVAYSICGQTNLSLCSQDSMSFSNVNKFFEGKTSISGFDLEFMFLRKEISQHKWEDGICGIIFFAKIFDNLLAMDLDLNYKMSPDNTPVVNSTMESFTPEFKKKNDLNLKMANLFIGFLAVNDTYQLYVIKDYYTTHKNIKFIKDVDNVIDFGAYTHPETVKKILLNNIYQHLTRNGVAKESIDNTSKKN